MHILISVDPDDLTDLVRAQQVVDQLLNALQHDSSSDPAGTSVKHEEGVAANAPGPPTTMSEDKMFDEALKSLYEDGRPRQGSLRFLEQALRYQPGAGYTISEIAVDLGVEDKDARAYRRNLGRALGWIEDHEVIGLPSFFRTWTDSGSNRYEVVPGVRSAAARRGLI